MKTSTTAGSLDCSEFPLGSPGIDPVATAEAILIARNTGEKLGPNPYGYARAFTTPVDQDDLVRLRSLLPDHPMVMDPMAGGGSIPFESIRMGFPTVAKRIEPSGIDSTRSYGSLSSRVWARSGRRQSESGPIGGVTSSRRGWRGSILFQPMRTFSATFGRTQFHVRPPASPYPCLQTGGSADR